MAIANWLCKYNSIIFNANLYIPICIYIAIASKHNFFTT